VDKGNDSKDMLHGDQGTAWNVHFGVLFQSPNLSFPMSSIVTFISTMSSIKDAVLHSKMERNNVEPMYKINVRTRESDLRKMKV